MAYVANSVKRIINIKKKMSILKFVLDCLVDSKHDA